MGIDEENGVERWESEGAARRVIEEERKGDDVKTG